jgi:hypothetical protein
VIALDEALSGAQKSAGQNLAAIIANINVIITALGPQPHNIGGFGFLAVYIGDN